MLVGNMELSLMQSTCPASANRYPGSSRHNEKTKNDAARSVMPPGQQGHAENGPHPVRILN